MNKKRKSILAQVIVSCLLVLFTFTVVHGETLQEEFDRLCVHTQDAESLSIEKLQELVAECDQLQKKIEASDDAKKKLLLFRLKKCRDFLAYIIALKEVENPDSSQ
jgi:cell division protein FtsB